MRDRCSSVIYWIVAALPLMIMTGLALIMTRQVLGGQFANWWTLTTLKLISITAVTVIVGIITGIPLAKTLTQSTLPLTVKGSLQAFSMTGIIVILNLLFALIVGPANVCETIFLVGYASSSLLLTFALCTAIYYLIR